MSWRLRLSAGFGLALLLGGVAAACPSAQPCIARGGGYYDAYGADASYQAYKRGYGYTYGYEQAYVSDGRGSYGYSQEYGPYGYSYGYPSGGAPHSGYPAYPPPGQGQPYPPPSYGPPPGYHPPPSHSYPPPYAGGCCAPCYDPCGYGGEVLPMSFFADTGGVGPIPMGGYGGGGAVFIGGGSGASASASASAQASAQVAASIAFRGGYKGGGHGGGKGGHGGGHYGGGKGH